MVYLHDIAPLSLWNEMVLSGYVNVQAHPELPYVIYNYSEICAFERVWNPVTLASRGLIVNRSTGAIISRVLSKFFNYGEPSIVPSDLVGEIVVSDKLDGSAGYSYPTPDGKLHIATRGSFTSDQAIHASNVLTERYEGLWAPVEGRTYLWEIIYPQNRIVVAYDFDDIVLLAAIDNETGDSYAPSQVPEWKWRKTEEFSFNTIEDALNAESRSNVEGYVIHFVSTNTRVKIKQADYVSLHKIVTGLNKRRVWEVMSNGQDFTTWIAGLPDEFVEDIEIMRSEVQATYDALETQIKDAFYAIVSELDDGFTQKEFASVVMREHKSISGFLFNVLSGHEETMSKKMWKAVEPDFEKPTWGFAGTKKVSE